jgi:hypothetical protein
MYQDTYILQALQRLVRSTPGSGVGAEELNALLSRAHTKIATALLDLEKYTTQAQTLPLPRSFSLSLPPCVSLARIDLQICTMQAQTETQTAVGLQGAFKDADYHSMLACDHLKSNTNAYLGRS